MFAFSEVMSMSMLSCASPAASIAFKRGQVPARSGQVPARKVHVSQLSAVPQTSTRMQTQVQDTNCVSRIQIPPEHFEGFYEDFHSMGLQDMFDWNAQDDPLRTHLAMAMSVRLVTKWLPDDVVSKLMSFTVDPEAPAALVLSGLPTDLDLPPTPCISTANNIGQGNDVRLPVCEAWVLGVARLMGYPFARRPFSPKTLKDARGLLLRDIVAIENHAVLNAQDLTMHRDFPSNVLGSSVPTPDAFLLFAARGDPMHQAKTLVISNKRVVELLEPSDIKTLREGKVHIEHVNADTGEVKSFGTPWNAVSGPEDNPLVTLFDAGAVFAHMCFQNTQVEEAFRRLEKVAFEQAEGSDLQSGDLLVLNHINSLHGRTAFEYRPEGDNRWLMKCDLLRSNPWDPCRRASQPHAVWPSFTPLLDA